MFPGSARSFGGSASRRLADTSPARLAASIGWPSRPLAWSAGIRARFEKNSFCITGRWERPSAASIASNFAYGKKDYILGGHPLWQMFRCTYRMTKRPYVIGGVALFAGYTAAF